ncbi:LysR family transcriptional regulator [Streptococcus dentapri]|uniref:LysR family transcriptional regulator n=1 Tax=Streptococcus dentapri TaxID=573564 RepID=A0ABV8D1N6_9STRE
MNFRDLEYFYQLSQLQSFTAVAKAFNVTQPTISYAIKRLETFFDCNLVVKDTAKRAVSLTPQGCILANHSKEMLHDLQRLNKELKQSQMIKTKIGFPPIIASYIVAQLTARQLPLSFLSDLQTIHGGSNELLEQLLDGEMELSLLGSLNPLVHPKLETKALWKKEFFFVLSENHPLATCKELSFADVLEENFILLDERHIHLNAFNILNGRYQNLAQVLVQLDDVYMVGQLIKENLGISLLTEISFPQRLEKIVKVPLKEDDIHFYISYAYLKTRHLSERSKGFIDILENLKRM